MAEKRQDNGDKGFHTYSTGEHPLSDISTDTVKEISELPGTNVVVDADKGTVRVELNTVDVVKKGKTTGK